MWKALLYVFCAGVRWVVSCVLLLVLYSVWGRAVAAPPLAEGSPKDPASLPEPVVWSGGPFGLCGTTVVRILSLFGRFGSVGCVLSFEGAIAVFLASPVAPGVPGREGRGFLEVPTPQ